MLQNLSFTTVFVLTVLNIELPRGNAVRFGRNVSLSNMLINVCKFLDHWAKVHHCDLFVVLSASLGEVSPETAGGKDELIMRVWHLVARSILMS